MLHASPQSDPMIAKVIDLTYRSGFLRKPMPWDEDATIRNEVDDAARRFGVRPVDLERYIKRWACDKADGYFSKLFANATWKES